MTGFRPRRASPTIFRGGGTRDFAWSRAAGGTPTDFDRLLCTRLGTKAGELLAEGRTNVMVGVRGTECVPVPLKRVAGIKRTVPPDHPWVNTARLVETCLGDGTP